MDENPPLNWTVVEYEHGAWVLVIVSDVRRLWPESTTLDMDNVNGEEEKETYRPILSARKPKVSPY